MGLAVNHIMVGGMVVRKGILRDSKGVQTCSCMVQLPSERVLQVDAVGDGAHFLHDNIKVDDHAVLDGIMKTCIVHGGGAPFYQVRLQARKYGIHIFSGASTSFEINSMSVGGTIHSISSLKTTEFGKRLKVIIRVQGVCPELVSVEIPGAGAEFLCLNARKGDMLFVEGRLRPTVVDFEGRNIYHAAPVAREKSVHFMPKSYRKFITTDKA